MKATLPQKGFWDIERMSCAEVGCPVPGGSHALGAMTIIFILNGAEAPRDARGVLP